jgi:transposase
MDNIPIAGKSGQTAPTSSRRSGHSAPIEIITRNARRRWSLEQKREIVAESLGPGLTPTEVARRHEISSGQLYTWRRDLLAMQTAMMTRSVPCFAEVEMIVPPAQPVGNNPAPGKAATLATPPLCSGGGLIEVVLPDGVVVRVDAQVDGAALRRVLDVLGGR